MAISMRDLSDFALGLVFVSAISGVGVIVLAALNSSTTNTDAQTAIGNGVTGIANFTAQFGTIGTVIGVVFLLGIVVVGLSGVRSGTSGGGL